MTVSENLFRRFRWPLFSAYTLLLFVASVLPPDRMPPAVAGIDDAWLHGTSYFFLALLARVTFSSSSLSIFRLHFEAKSAMFSMGYGALLEGVQQIVPGRSASFSDWLWDGAGVFLALAFVRLRDFFGGKKQSSFS